MSQPVISQSASQPLVSQSVSQSVSHDQSVSRAANNLSFLKGSMSDQVSSLVGQNRNVVGSFFSLLLFLSGSLFKIIISYLIYLLFGKKICPDIMSNRS